jgi:hypothetical protein
MSINSMYRDLMLIMFLQLLNYRESKLKTFLFEIINVCTTFIFEVTFIFGSIRSSTLPSSNYSRSIDR